MIHFKPIIDTERIKSEYVRKTNAIGLVRYKYPYINKKVIEETAISTNNSKEKVANILSYWNKFLDQGMKAKQKVKLPYVGSFHISNPYREKNIEVDEEDFNEVEFNVEEDGETI